MVSTPFFRFSAIDIAQRDAAAVVDAFEMLQQIAAAAAGADHAELHLVVRGPDFLNGGRALYGGDGGGYSRYGSGGFQQIAAGEVVFLCHEKGNLEN